MSFLQVDFETTSKVMKKAGLRSVEKNAGSPEMQNDSFQLPEDFGGGGVQL